MFRKFINKFDTKLKVSQFEKNEIFLVGEKKSLINSRIFLKLKIVSFDRDKRRERKKEKTMGKSFFKNP